MSALYQSARAVLYCGDARIILPFLAKESMSLLVTDPPYGQNQQSNRRETKFDLIEGDATLDEAEKLLADVTPDLVRLLKGRRHSYTFGLPMQHPLLPVKAELIWDKDRNGSGDLSSVWSTSHEKIYFQVRAPDKTNAAQGAGALAARLRRGSVLRVPRLSANQVHQHPTEKPVDLLRILIESSSQQNEIVLDPFAGSGSTGVAALLEGRRFFGIELDAKYAAGAAKRLKAVDLMLDQMGNL